MLAPSDPRLLQRIVENTLDYVHVAAPTGEILYATPTCERVLGRSAAELVGRDAFALVHPDDVARARAGAEALARGGPGARLPLQLRVLHADGSYRWLEGAGVNFLDDDAVGGLIVACIDVTARRAAQDALLDHERRFHALVERSAEITSIGDADGVITYVSPAVETVLGYPPAELLGASALALTHPDDAARVDDHFTRLRGEPGAVMRCQYRVRSKAGAWRWMDVVATNLLADPAVRGVVVNQHDITTHRQLEAEAERAHRVAALGRVTGAVAHDFANLLVVIESIAALGVRRSDDPRAVRALMSELQEVSGRAAALTRQLLRFGGKEVSRPVPIDIDQHLRALEPMLRRITGDNVELVLRPGATTQVEIDPAQLDQVLLNLVVNARDAMPGGGTVTIRTGTRPPSQVVIAISDTGIGMTAEVQERVFEPFFTTKPPGEGTGLGLATVFGIIKQSGGDITVTTSPGQGTTFEIVLPRLVVDGG